MPNIVVPKKLFVADAVEKVPSALPGNPMTSSSPPCPTSGKIQDTNDQQTTRALCVCLFLTRFIYYAQERHTVAEHAATRAAIAMPRGVQDATPNV